MFFFGIKPGINDNKRVAFYVNERYSKYGEQKGD